VIRRRSFIAGLGSAAAWPVVARAQQQAIPVVGLLDATNSSSLIPALKLGLSQSGWVEGRTVAFELRTANGEYDRLPALANELVRRRVAAIGAITPVAALAAKAATTTIPIVFCLGSDPVKDGLVSSLNRPGGNVTGVTFFNNLLTAKRLEFLHEIIPNAAIAMLVNPNNANAELELRETEIAARTLGLQLVVVRASDEREVDEAFAILMQQRSIALLVAADAYLNRFGSPIVTLATRHGIPTSVVSRDLVVSGGLMSYGTDWLNSSRQAGIYISRILKGEKPADLPVIQPTKFQLVLNLNTAKVLNLEIPAKILALADEVIQ
jgi:putative ABC transport system substrate-binding protein